MIGWHGRRFLQRRRVAAHRHHRIGICVSAPVSAPSSWWQSCLKRKATQQSTCGARDNTFHKLGVLAPSPPLPPMGLLRSSAPFPPLPPQMARIAEPDSSLFSAIVPITVAPSIDIRGSWRKLISSNNNHANYANPFNQGYFIRVRRKLQIQHGGRSWLVIWVAATALMLALDGSIRSMVDQKCFRMPQPWTAMLRQTTSSAHTRYRWLRLICSYVRNNNGRGPYTTTMAVSHTLQRDIISKI